MFTETKHMLDLSSSPATTALVAGSLSVVIYICYNKLQQISTKKSNNVNYPPYPQPLHWLWGNAPDLPRDGQHPDIQFLKWAMELGPIYSVKIPLLGTLMVVADPELIQHICVSKNSRFNKSWTYSRQIPLLGESSIVLTHGETWLNHRKTFAPGFTTAFLKDMTHVMCDKLQRFTKGIDKELADSNADINLLKHTQTFTADVIVQIAFGEDWVGDGADDNNDTIASNTTGSAGNISNCDKKQDNPQLVARGYLEEMASIITTFANNPVASLFGFRMKRRLKETTSKLDAIMDQLITRQQQEQRKLDTKTHDTSKSGIQLKKNNSVLALAMQSMSQPLSQEDRTVILDQLKTFYFAGHDTTATTIAWAGWLLSQHPDKVSKLRKELTAHKIFSSARAPNPTYDQLQQCDYLDAVVKETLRLYPPAATARYTSDLSETWKGYTLGGAVLYINCYITHRLPQYWENPNDFQPERYVGVEPTKYNHKYIPFLRGPRDCLGKYFALLEAKLAISALVQRYDLVECVDPGEKIGYRTTAFPMDGACVRMKLRDG